MKWIEFLVENSVVSLYTGIGLTVAGLFLFLIFARVRHMVLMLLGFWGIVEVMFALGCNLDYYPKIVKMLSEMPDIYAFLTSLAISAVVVCIFLMIVLPPAVGFWKQIKFREYYRAKKIQPLLEIMEGNTKAKAKYAAVLSKYDGYEDVLDKDTSITFLLVIFFSVLLYIIHPLFVGFFDLMWDWFEKTFGFILGDILAGIICLAIGAAVIIGLWVLWWELVGWADDQIDKKN